MGQALLGQIKHADKGHRCKVDIKLALLPKQAIQVNHGNKGSQRHYPEEQHV